MLFTYLASLYDRGMAIEEQIQDTKGARFGLQLVWTQIKTPEAMARFTLPIGLPLLRLTMMWHAFSLRRPDVRLPSKTKKPRLSLVTTGRLFFFSFLPHQKLSQPFLIQNLPIPVLRSLPGFPTQPP
jgi:hypothetical protein